MSKNWEIIKQVEERFRGRKIFVDSNKVCIIGEIMSDFQYNHTVYNERFYKSTIRVKRLSGTVDEIPVIVSEVMLRENKFTGSQVQVCGRFSSRNINGHTQMVIFVRLIRILEEPDCNFIYCDGFVCKPPKYRTTKISAREITDLFVAVNRPYHKSDYIPCIVWGRAALWASKLEVGVHVKFEGRIQSRQYIKEDQEHTVYEVSIARIWPVDKIGEEEQ